MSQNPDYIKKYKHYMIEEWLKSILLSEKLPATVIIRDGFHDPEGTLIAFLRLYDCLCLPFSFYEPCSEEDAPAVPVYEHAPAYSKESEPEADAKYDGEHDPEYPHGGN